MSRVIWSDEDPPGGYVCAECWMPVESEPCPEHGSEPLSARECRLCGLTAGDLPDGVGFEDEGVLADFFEGGVCEGCRS